jgi:anti-sigma factor RsiW
LTQQDEAAKGLRRFGMLCLVFICGALTAVVGASLIRGMDGFIPSPAVNEHIEDQAFALRTMAALQSFSQEEAISQDAAQTSPKAALILPSLAEDGFGLAGLRIFSNSPTQMACLFYAKPASPPLTLCVEAAGHDDLNLNSLGAFPKLTLYWQQKHARYAFSGPLGEAELRNLAQIVQSRIESFNPPLKF